MDIINKMSNIMRGESPVNITCITYCVQYYEFWVYLDTYTLQTISKLHNKGDNIITQCYHNIIAERVSHSSAAALRVSWSTAILLIFYWFPKI